MLSPTQLQINHFPSRQAFVPWMNNARPWRGMKHAALTVLAAAGSGPQPTPKVAVDELPRLISSDYQALQNPHQYSMTYTNAVREFVKSAVLAYECGYSEEIMRQHLRNVGTEQPDGQMDELCWRFISLVWVLLDGFVMELITRCRQAVSEETLLYWKSFVKMIAKGYFDKRMSWFPIDRLLMERSFTTGASQKPELVAESARIVFTTLDLIAPQFPSM